MAMKIGRDLYMRLREEGTNTGQPIRTPAQVKNSQVMRKFCAEALALREEGSGYARIPDKAPQITIEDISLRELAANTIVHRETGESVGDSFIQEYFNTPDDYMRLREAGGTISAVDYSQFASISGSLAFNSLLTGFQNEEYIFSQTAGRYPTKMVSGERIPGVAPPKPPDVDGNDDGLLVRPQQPFRYTQFGERYIDLPGTELRGLIIGVDRLAIYGDLTGQVAQQAKEVGDLLGYSKERRGLKTLIGVETYAFVEKRAVDTAPVTIDPYQWASGVAATQLTHANFANRPYPFVNDMEGDPLVDYTDIRDADIQFTKMRDPDTGRPVIVGKPFIFATKAQEQEISRILQAYNIWKLSQGVNTAGAVLSVSPGTNDVLGHRTDVRLSRLLRIELVAAGCTGLGGNPDPDKMWFYGDVAESIKYAENWPIQMIQAPPNSEAEFLQDIVIRWRASERGKWVWMNPRLMQRHNYRNPA